MRDRDGWRGWALLAVRMAGTEAARQRLSAEQRPVLFGRSVGQMWDMGG